MSGTGSAQPPAPPSAESLLDLSGQVVVVTGPRPAARWITGTVLSVDGGVGSRPPF